MRSIVGAILIPIFLLHSGYGNPVSLQDKTIYTFGFGDHFRPFEFISESGDLVGFNVDIVRRVCELANKKCAFIVYNDYSLCWNNQTRLSEGLNHRYWDVCIYTQYKEVMLTYGFLGMFAQEMPAYLYARAGTSFTKYDPARHQIGFAKGCRFTPACMKNRMGITVPAPRYYDTCNLLMAGLENDEVQVVFVVELMVQIVGAHKFRKISEETRCGENGLGLMMRKDTIPKYQWFDKTLRKEVLPSKYYSWACNIAKFGYGGEPFCFE